MSDVVQFIINPMSGRSTGGAKLARFQARLRQLGLVPELYVTKGPHDARRFAATLSERIRAVVVAGGDGTVSEVAGGLMDHPIPLWMLPGGTENLLAKVIGYGHDPDEMFDALRRNRVGVCDLGLIDDRPWLIIAGVGIDGEIVKRVMADRQGHITFWSYFWPAWRSFWEYRYPVLRVTADGRQIFDDPGLVFVGNMSRYAVGLPLLQEARCNDGLLDVRIFRCRNQAELLTYFGAAAARCRLILDSTIYLRCRSLTIESTEPVPCQADGDPAGHLPVTVCIVPQRVRLLLPSKTSRDFSDGGAPS